MVKSGPLDTTVNLLPLEVAHAAKAGMALGKAKRSARISEERITADTSCDCAGTHIESIGNVGEVLIETTAKQAIFSADDVFNYLMRRGANFVSRADCFERNHGDTLTALHCELKCIEGAIEMVGELYGGDLPQEVIQTINCGRQAFKTVARKATKYR